MGRAHRALRVAEDDVAGPDVLRAKREAEQIHARRTCRAAFRDVARADGRVELDLNVLDDRHEVRHRALGRLTRAGRRTSPAGPARAIGPVAFLRALTLIVAA